MSHWLAQEKLFFIAAVLKAQNYFIKVGEWVLQLLLPHHTIQSWLHPVYAGWTHLQALIGKWNSYRTSTVAHQDPLRYHALEVHWLVYQIRKKTKLMHSGASTDYILSEYSAVMSFRKHLECLILSSLCWNDLQEAYRMWVPS